MMTTPRPIDGGTRRRLALCALMLTAPLLTGCGGDPAGGAVSGGSTTSSPTPAASRPEGAWTLVAWTLTRSDAKDVQSVARTVLATFRPSCPSGPCDVTLSPAGAEGTFREPESPLLEGDTGSSTKVALTWDGKSYTSQAPAQTVSCTPAAGRLVANGYSVTSRMALAFVPATALTPARVHGTITHSTKGTAAGRPKGCTDFEETEAVGGVATGSLDTSTPLTGEYAASITSTGSTPKALAPAGTTLWLGPMSVSGTGAGTTITGLNRSAGALISGPKGWSATAPVAPTDCRSPADAVVAKGAEGSETFADLHAVSLTEDGTAILAGSWRDRINPNTTGLKADCSLTVYEGRLLLVPAGAGP